MKIIERFNDIKDIYNIFDIIPFYTQNEKKSLWYYYLFNHSGQKEESPFLGEHIFKNNEMLINTLSSFIETMFLDKWTRLHDALMLEYGVIDNYNRIEDTETNTVGGSNVNSTINSSDTMTGGHTNSIGEESSTEFNNNHSTSAYDSDIYVNDNADKSSTGENVSREETFTYNNENKIVNSETESETENTNNVITHSVIKGNIGVTTSQQMILSELELRKYNIIDTIYRDVDSVLTLAIYI